MTTPEVDILARLVAAGVGVEGVDLLRGPMRDGEQYPDALVTVIKYDGLEAVSDIGDALRYRTRYVQVEIRGPRNDYTAAHDKAEAVFEALHAQHPDTYVQWVAQEPAIIEQDSSERTRLAVRVRCESHN